MWLPSADEEEAGGGGGGGAVADQRAKAAEMAANLGLAPPQPAAASAATVSSCGAVGCHPAASHPLCSSFFRCCLPATCPPCVSFPQFAKPPSTPDAEKARQLAILTAQRISRELGKGTTVSGCLHWPIGCGAHVYPWRVQETKDTLEGELEINDYPAPARMKVGVGGVSSACCFY